MAVAKFNESCNVILIEWLWIKQQHLRNKYSCETNDLMAKMWNSTTKDRCNYIPGDIEPKLAAWQAQS